LGHRAHLLVIGCSVASQLEADDLAGADGWRPQSKAGYKSGSATDFAVGVVGLDFHAAFASISSPLDGYFINVVAKIDTLVIKSKLLTKNIYKKPYCGQLW
jgi:hypothetical protein